MAARGAPSLFSPSRAAAPEDPPPSVGSQGDGPHRPSVDRWQALLIGRSLEEIQIFQAQMASLCQARDVQVTPTTVQETVGIGQERRTVHKWSDATLAAFQRAGLTTADVQPQFDQQPLSTPVRGKPIWPSSLANLNLPRGGGITGGSRCQIGNFSQKEMRWSSTEGQGARRMRFLGDGFVSPSARRAHTDWGPHPVGLIDCKPVGLKGVEPCGCWTANVTAGYLVKARVAIVMGMPIDLPLFWPGLVVWEPMA